MFFFVFAFVLLYLVVVSFCFVWLFGSFSFVYSCVFVCGWGLCFMCSYLWFVTFCVCLAYLFMACSLFVCLCGCLGVFCLFTLFILSWWGLVVFAHSFSVVVWVLYLLLVCYFFAGFGACLSCGCWVFISGWVLGWGVGVGFLVFVVGFLFLFSVFLGCVCVFCFVFCCLGWVVCVVLLVGVWVGGLGFWFGFWVGFG